MAELMTFAQYAKHRGITRQAVSKAVRGGRISVVCDKNDNRRIDPAVVDREWERNTFPNVKRRLCEEEDPLSYSESRAMREQYKAKMAKVEYDQRIGRLVLVEKVKNEGFKLGRMLRQGLMSMPDRIAAIVASETDPGKVHACITKELNNVLEVLDERIQWT